MIRTALAILLCVAASVARAAEDPSAIARDLSGRFVTACEKGDVAAALALYVDDATVVYPVEGARAEGKAELAKVLEGMCVKGEAGSSRFLKGSGRFVGAARDEIAASAEWETTSIGPDGKPASGRLRTTELLVKTPAGWRYRIDHASIGIPLPAPVSGGTR